ncbi:RNA ligase family protein [Streptomyces sp. BI20]|uniref:RNA ligase family protein n=1 Tax=Streptomyces sp. BI20 TaxID=3403460 RepID=UPI003C71C92F
MRTPYPRTPHLPWSPGASGDDLRVVDLDGLRGREVVVTEKFDGENTTLYRDGCHARSVDSGPHPSRAWVKALTARVGGRIPAGTRICGENLHARHSLPYEDLESWFLAFSVWAGERCLGWDETVRLTHRLGLPAVPVLWRGVFDERALRRLRVDPARQEGYVVRVVEGFDRAEFGRRVAKWVRPHHVTTDTHWMYAPVVPNGLGPAAALWAVRSGAAPDPGALRAAVLPADPGPAPEPGPCSGPAPDSVSGSGSQSVRRLAEVTGRLDAADRFGDARLTGVLAHLLAGHRPAALGVLAAPALGPRQARVLADLVSVAPLLTRPFPDAERRAGLAGLGASVDLAVAHAVAAAGARDAAEAEAVDWSGLHAQEAGLWGEDPWAELRDGVRAGLDAAGVLDPWARDLCWARARENWARGTAVSPAEALAATWAVRAGGFPRLLQLVGPSGSGKSTFASGLPGPVTVVSPDGIRGERGDRADQGDNARVLALALDRLDAALTEGGEGRTVVWDATGLTARQRSGPVTVARRRGALVTQVAFALPAAERARRNAARPHAVPAEVLTRQERRFEPPRPGAAHRVWWVGARGTVVDRVGTLEEFGNAGTGTGAGIA